MNDFVSFLYSLQSYLWCLPVLFLLMGAGIFLTISLKGIQFIEIGRSFLLIFKKEKNNRAEGDISPFESLMTAVASAVGTGNIVGVATAITVGGAGSIFWMWVTAFLSMAIKYSETLLAVKYRAVNKNGEMQGGPMYYIEKGLGWKSLALFFAGTGAIATLGTGNFVQMHSIACVFHSSFGMSHAMTGCLLALITGIILIKGIKRIGYVLSFLVPVMILFYLIAGLIILFIQRDKLPEAFSLILSSAFTGQAATGGFLGSTMIIGLQMGASRSILSSEAGLGISSIGQAAAKTSSPGRQALMAITGVWISSLIVCTITALVILSTGVLGALDSDGKIFNGVALACEAFEKALPGGSVIVMIGLLLFAYSTALAWAYYGEKCFEYIFGERLIIWYRLIFSLISIPACLFALEIVWPLADIMNSLLMIPNLFALFALSGVIKKETELFFRSRERAIIPQQQAT